MPSASERSGLEGVVRRTTTGKDSLRSLIKKTPFLGVFFIFFMILILLILPSALGAEEADPSFTDSFDKLTEELLPALNKVEHGSVLAVLDIGNSDGRNSALGNYLEEGLAEFLIPNTDLALVERNQIGQVFEEWEYSLSGMVSEDSMQQIGNMAGADAVLVGVLARVEQRVKVNLRIIDTESALVLASVNTLFQSRDTCRCIWMFLTVKS